jgi:hypothetical protein
MRIAYTVPGATSSAFTPIPCINGSALNYKGAVVGQPGTQGIPAPYPGVHYSTANGTRVNSGYSGGSENMPQVQYPQLWYQRSLDIPGAQVISGGMAIFSDNQMPIPARLPWGKAARLAKPPTFLGQRQIQQPRALPRWADWLPGRDFGS